MIRKWFLSCDLKAERHALVCFTEKVSSLIGGVFFVLSGVCLPISGGLDSAALTNLIRGGLFELGFWSPKRHAGVAQVSVGKGLRNH